VIHVFVVLLGRSLIELLIKGEVW